VLNRRFLQVGDIVRVGRGTWGLKEWYPNRSFKAPSKGDEPRSEAPLTAEEMLRDDPTPQEEQPKPWDLDQGTRQL
jgi:hypothetical protein